MPRYIELISLGPKIDYVYNGSYITNTAYNETLNPSHKLLRPMQKMVLFRFSTSNVKLVLETIWSA